jgi:hypothetical protein
MISGAAGNSAARAQAQASADASERQWAQYNQTRNDLAPYRQAGTQALGQLQSELPNLTRQFSAADFQADPGYAFNMQQGNQAIQRSAASRGLLNSTGTMKNMANFSQNLASNEYGNAYNRFTQNQNQRLGALQNLSSGGQNAAVQTGGFGANAVNAISNNMMGAANAQGANAIAQGNNMNGLLGNLSNSWMNYSMMNRPPPQQQQTMQQIVSNNASNNDVNFDRPNV